MCVCVCVCVSVCVLRGATTCRKVDIIGVVYNGWMCRRLCRAVEWVPVSPQSVHFIRIMYVMYELYEKNTALGSNPFQFCQPLRTISSRAPSPAPGGRGGGRKRKEKKRTERPSVRRDAVPRQLLLDGDASRLIKANASTLHDGENLALGGDVESAPAIVVLDVGSQAEGVAMKARFQIRREGRRGRGDHRQPGGAADVECCTVGG